MISIAESHPTKTSLEGRPPGKIPPGRIPPVAAPAKDHQASEIRQPVLAVVWWSVSKGDLIAPNGFSRFLIPVFRATVEGLLP